MDTNPSAAGDSVAPHLRRLRQVGFCQLDPTSQSRRPILALMHRVYHRLVLAATVLYIFEQLTYAYQARNDMERLSRVLFLMLCHLTCIAKQFVFHSDADKINQLVVGLDDALCNQPVETHRLLLLETSRRAARLLMLYSGCAVSTCILWAVFPLLDQLRGRTVEFAFWIPIDYRHNAFQFAVVLAYAFYSTSLVAVANTTMDAFIATVLYQCTTQLRILRMNFESLPERAYALSRKTRQDYHTVTHELLVDCLLHYKKITETCNLLEQIFGKAILVQFGVGGWILCMAAYQIVDMEILSIEFASTALFMGCILTELFLYCYYGNEVTVQSGLVSESVYAMSWLSLCPRERRALVVVLERARRPLRPAAGRVVPLTLNTYLKILKSSYSFYAVLRQTK
ncbi:olfactory receptor 59 [Bombyx mori]|uniref:Odorant receptor n=1 Tax=Bombyx mori TaxID=7091 RepID=C4B7Y7_BOMMO|nr:olfactory receptor 59 [Bombyx mori]BAH66353.1 olfactory receptor [Bombyx mori]